MSPAVGSKFFGSASPAGILIPPAFRLTRVGEWEVRLARYLAVHQEDPFVYGSWDCALFVCGAIEAMTDVDPALWFRGRYGSRSEARLAMREHCGTSQFEKFFGLMASNFGMEEVPILMGRRGDVVFMFHEGRPSLGLISLDGQRCIIVGETTTGRQGLGFVPLEDAVRVWRV